MRDPRRIYSFCNELANIWLTQCPDWRFGQLLNNVIGNTDCFYIEEDEMLGIFRNYFNMNNDINNKKNKDDNNSSNKEVDMDMYDTYKDIIIDFFNDENSSFKVTFKDKNGNKKIIGFAIGSNKACKLIYDFLDEHNYKSYYKKFWVENGKIQVDVGSWTELFYIERMN